MWSDVNGSRVLLVYPALAAGLVGSVTSTGAMTGPLVKNVNGWITALVTDGPQVAYATRSFAPTDCFKLVTWNVATGSGVLASGPKTGRCGSGSLGISVSNFSSRIHVATTFVDSAPCSGVSKRPSELKMPDGRSRFLH